MGEIEVWRAVVQTLGLGVDGRDGEALVHVGAVDGVDLELASVAVDANRVRITATLRDRLAVPGPWLLAPRTAMLTEPRAVTGDPAFDAHVGIAIDGPELLSCLGPDARPPIREALGLVASLAPDGARVTAAAVGRLTDPETAVHAIRTVAAALVALRVPSLEALVRRYRQDDEAPGVSRAVEDRVESSLHAIRGPDLLVVCERMARSASDVSKLVAAASAHAEVFDAWLHVAPDDPRLIEVSEAALYRWRGHAQLGAVAASFLRREGPSAAFRRLWALPGVAAQFAAVDAVLDIIPTRPPGECRDLLLALRAPEVRTAIKLAALLEHEPDPSAVDRLEVLFRIYPAYVAAPLVRRAHVDRPTRPGQVEAVIPRLRAWQGSPEQWSALLDGLLALPTDAADLIGALSPRDEAHQLRVIRWLARGRGAAVEAALLGWLELGSLDVRIAAARALGAAGGTAALRPLDDVAGGWMVNGDLRSVAREAARAIRARPGVGGLSIASDSAGGMSPADD